MCWRLLQWQSNIIYIITVVKGQLNLSHDNSTSASILFKSLYFWIWEINYHTAVKYKNRHSQNKQLAFQAFFYKCNFIYFLMSEYRWDKNNSFLQPHTSRFISKICQFLPVFPPSFVVCVFFPSEVRTACSMNWNTIPEKYLPKMHCENDSCSISLRPKS